MRWGGVSKVLSDPPGCRRDALGGPYRLRRDHGLRRSVGRFLSRVSLARKEPGGKTAQPEVQVTLLAAQPPTKNTDEPLGGTRLPHEGVGKLIGNAMATDMDNAQLTNAKRRINSEDSVRLNLVGCAHRSCHRRSVRCQPLRPTSYR